MLLTFFYLHKAPKQVHQFMGVLQWFDLLVRPKLSVYSTVYKFTQNKEHLTVEKLPESVLAELACSLAWASFWRCDLRRPFLPLLGATDASSSYGFGASTARISSALARRISRWAEKQGSFIVMDGGTSVEDRIGVSIDDFTDVLKVRSKFAAHINVLEGAFVIFLSSSWIRLCGWALQRKAAPLHS